MGDKFQIVLLEDTLDFVNSLDLKTRLKIYYNLDSARQENDPKLYKKLTDDIWDFRTKYNGLQYCLFAFWNKTDKRETVVITTHGIIKKVDKVPKSDIDKAMKIRSTYFEL